MQVNWFNRNGSLSLAYDQPKPKAWTETYTQWSPLGTFLVTVHGQGVALWGGASFDRINRFAHPGANLIDFSPNERYLVTWSPKPLEIPPGALNNPNFPYTEDDEGSQVCIWEVLTGKLMRSFPMLAPPPPPPANAQGVPEEKKRQHFVWPLFKWSGDERYFARLNPGIQIQIYETPHFGLLQKKSVKIDGVVDFDWCPLGDKEREQDAAREEAIAKGEKNVVDQETMLAYWVPEIANQPARVTLMSVPSRTTLRSKNLVNVSDVRISRSLSTGLRRRGAQCKIHWQSNGDFLCVKVDRHTKTKKTMFSNLEIFRVREKGLPVDTIDVKGG
jgi:translation initiation factor 3 subunit B